MIPAEEIEKIVEAIGGAAKVCLCFEVRKCGAAYNKRQENIYIYTHAPMNAYPYTVSIFFSF